MHPFQVISGLLGFMLVTSKEIVWFRPWTGAPVYNAVVTALFAIHFLSLFTRFEQEELRLKIRFSLKWEKLPGLDLLVKLSVVLSAYFLIHELLVGDGGKGYKYSVYTLFLLSLIAQNYDFTAVCKIFSVLAIVTSVVLIVQCLLIVFVLENNLTGLDMVTSYRPDGRLEFRHYAPFWLGLVAEDGRVSYPFFEFYRANAFTTEPKYCSQVLIGGLVSSLYVARSGSSLRRIGIPLILVGLLVSHAYSIMAVLVFAYLLLRLGKYRNASLYALVASGLIFLSVTLLSNYASSFTGYASHRVGSFLTQMDLADAAVFRVSGLFGNGADSELAMVGNLPPFMRLTIQMGIVGTALNALLMFFALSQTLKGIYHSRSQDHRILMALACSLIVTFNTFFTSEPISPLYSFLYALIFRTSGRWVGSSAVKNLVYKPLVRFAPST